MTTMSSRFYGGEADLEPVLALLRASRTIATLDEYPTVADMRELLRISATDPEANLCLWQAANGQLIGYGMVHLPYGNLLFDALPLAQSIELVDQIMSWMVERARALKRTHSDLETLNAYCLADDAARRASVERHGFVRQETCTVTMERLLDEPTPPFALPEGWTLRSLAGPDEVPAYVALHRAAFGTTYMTVEGRLASLRDPDYQPELDLLAVTPDNTLAAFCVCSISSEQNARRGRNQGEIALIGTRPDLKDRGLGRAMLLAGLRRLWACGAAVAVLNVSSDNSIARHLYESVGFCTVSTRLWYSRSLDI